MLLLLWDTDLRCLDLEYARFPQLLKLWHPLLCCWCALTAKQKPSSMTWQELPWTEGRRRCLLDLLAILLSPTAVRLALKSWRHSRIRGGQARSCIPLQGFHLRQLPLIVLYLCDQKILSVISCQCVSYQETPLPQTPKDRSAFPAAGPGCREEEEEGQPASREMW